MTSRFEAKGQARRLAAYLSSIDLRLNYGQALEAVARSHGAPSWNVFSSQTELRPTEGASGATASAREWSTLERIVEQAALREFGPVHLTLRGDHVQISHRVRGRLQRVARLDAYQGLQLTIELANRFAGRANSPFSASSVPVGPSRILVSAHRVPVKGGDHVVLQLERPAHLDSLRFSLLPAWLKVFDAPRGLIVVTGDENSQHLVRGTITRLFSETSNQKCIEISEPDNHSLVVTAAARADYDLIVMPELRTSGHVESAVRAVEGGKLVLTSVRGGLQFDQALERLRALIGADTSDLESRLQKALLAVLVQHMVNPICVHCAGDGCSSCFDTGFGPVETLAALLTSESGEDGNLWSLLRSSTLHFHTLADDLMEKQQRGMRFPTEVKALFGTSH